MSFQLRVVSRMPAFARPLKGDPTVNGWMSLGARAYDDCDLDYCCDPVVLADRHGLAVDDTDDRCSEVIGGVIYCPQNLSFQDHCLIVYYGLGRTLLLRDRQTPTADAIEWVVSSLVLPKVVASRVYLSELDQVNPFAPIEYLRLVYMSYRRSGEMPALC